MIRFFVIGLLLFSLSLFSLSETDVFLLSSKEFIKNLSQKISSQDVVTIDSIVGDSNNNFKKILITEAIKRNVKIIEFNNLKKLQDLSIKQSDISFDEKMELGKFKQSNILISGKIKNIRKLHFLKQYSQFDILLQASSISDGIVIDSYYKSYHDVQKPSLIVLLFLCVSIYMIIYLLNKYSKGYYYKVYFSVLIVLELILFIWYFFI